MIHRQREFRQRAHLDVFVTRYDAISLPADRENRRLWRIDDRGEAVRAPCAEIRDADRRSVELFALQSTLQGSLDAILAEARNFREAEPLEAYVIPDEERIITGVRSVLRSRL